MTGVFEGTPWVPRGSLCSNCSMCVLDWDWLSLQLHRESRKKFLFRGPPPWQLDLVRPPACQNFPWLTLGGMLLLIGLFCGPSNRERVAVESRVSDEAFEPLRAAASEAIWGILGESKCGRFGQGFCF